MVAIRWADVGAPGVIPDDRRAETSTAPGPGTALPPPRSRPAWTATGHRRGRGRSASLRWLSPRP